MAAPLSPEAIRDVNVRYHDLAASSYDAKWGIDFNDVFQEQVLAKLRRALGTRTLGPWRRSLEIGAGTGYFTLNLLRAGVIAEATATDIAPGMLAALSANARRLGLAVATEPCDAERLPFAGESFDVVFGHAILHHIPDLRTAFAEFHRVLAPGGVVVFAGEPSLYGDRLATVPKRGAALAAPVWRTLMRADATPRPSANGAAPSPGGDDEHELERQVDVHAFAPADLRAAARGAGFERVRVRGEELLANWFGWANRTLEASAEPVSVPMLWRQYAYHGYLALQRVDRTLLEPRLPAELFYNLMVSGYKAR